MRKLFAHVLWTLAAVVLLAVAAYITLYLVAGNRHQAALARLSEPVSPVARAAIADHTGRAASSLKDTAPTADAQTRYDTYARLFTLTNERLEDDEQWKRLQSDALGRDVSTFSDDDWRTLEEVLAANQDLLEAVREAVRLGGPVAAYSLDFMDPETVDEFLSRNASVWAWARLLWADALHHGHSGDVDAAVADVVAGFRLVDAVSAQPLMISQLKAFAVSGAMAEAIRDGLPPGDLSREQVLRLLRGVETDNHRDALADALLVECQTIAAGIDDAMSRQTGWPRLVAELERPLWNLNLSTHIDAVDRLAEAARRPYFQAAPILADLQGEVLDLPFWNQLATIGVPAQCRAIASQARTEAMTDLMRVGLLLELHYTERGEYPATLDAIAADLGGHVPVDPFTGEPYHYTPAGTTFTLYSVGQNFDDDGGVHDFRYGDIVWRGQAEE